MEASPLKSVLASTGSTVLKLKARVPTTASSSSAWRSRGVCAYVPQPLADLAPGMGHPPAGEQLVRAHGQQRGDDGQIGERVQRETVADVRHFDHQGAETPGRRYGSG